MAYYKVRIEVWCDWNPSENDVEEIGESGAGEAICTKREVMASEIGRKTLKTTKPWAFLAEKMAMRTKVRARADVFKRIPDPGLGPGHSPMFVRIRD
jgi:hypothetical protein